MLSVSVCCLSYPCNLCLWGGCTVLTLSVTVWFLSEWGGGGGGGKEGGAVFNKHCLLKFLVTFADIFRPLRNKKNSLGLWEGLRFVTVALPGLFSYLFLYNIWIIYALYKLYILSYGVFYSPCTRCSKCISNIIMCRRY